MIPCKFQTDIQGASVLVYSEDMETVYAQATGFVAGTLIAILSIDPVMGKVFAMAEQDDAGRLHVGEVLPDQDW